MRLIWFYMLPHRVCICGIKKKKKNTISREVPQQSTATDIICSQINCWCVFIHSGGVSGTPGSQSDLLTTEQLRWGRLGLRVSLKGTFAFIHPAFPGDWTNNLAIISSLLWPLGPLLPLLFESFISFIRLWGRPLWHVFILFCPWITLEERTRW